MNETGQANLNKSVLYIGGFNLPDRNAAAQRVVSNAKIFRSLGYRVFLTGLGEGSGWFEHEGFECINLKYPETPGEWYRYLFTGKRTEQFINRINPSFVVAYNYPAAALERIRSFCKKKNIRVIADCTEWYTAEGGFFFRKIKDWDTRKRMTVVHPKLDAVISISRFLYDYYSAQGVKTLLLPPLVDAEEPKWAGTPQSGSGPLRLVYAGSPGHKDRLDTIVRSLSPEQDGTVTFTVIGLDETQFRSLYQFAGAIPAGVVFKGRMSHKDALEELKKADFQIFVREDNLSTRAGFPTKFVESVSAGIPVLTNLTSNIADYLSEDRNGYVLDASSELALQESLHRALQTDRDRIQALKKSIDNRTFDYRRFTEAVKEFLK